MPEHNPDTQGQSEGFLIDLPDRLAPGHRPGLPFEQVDEQEDDRHGDQDDEVPGCTGEGHESGPIVGSTTTRCSPHEIIKASKPGSGSPGRQSGAFPSVTMPFGNCVAIGLPSGSVWPVSVENTTARYHASAPTRQALSTSEG